MKFHKSMLLLYAVTDRTWAGSRTLANQVEEALEAGVTMVQLREKEMETEAFLEEAMEIRKITKAYQVPLIINDNIEVALACDADGLHVGQEDLAAEKARKILGSDKILGVTAKTVEQAQKAWHQGADYLGTGAVFGSSTKTNALPMSLDMFKKITESVPIPVAAIGGINKDNILELQGCGAAGVAVVSGIFACEDIKTAVSDLKEKAIQVRGF